MVIQARGLQVRPGAILIVDDELGVLRLIVRVWERNGFRVFSASSGVETVEVLRRNSEAITLALIDEDMPGMDGWATARALRVMKRSLDCCLMGNGMSPPEQERLAPGIAWISPKPFGPLGVARCLWQLQESHLSLVHPEWQRQPGTADAALEPVGEQQRR